MSGPGTAARVTDKGHRDGAATRSGAGPPVADQGVARPDGSRPGALRSTLVRAGPSGQITQGSHGHMTIDGPWDPCYRLGTGQSGTVGRGSCPVAFPTIAWPRCWPRRVGA